MDQHHMAMYTRLWSAELQQWVHECRLCKERVVGGDKTQLEWHLQASNSHTPEERRMLANLQTLLDQRERDATILRSSICSATTSPTMTATTSSSNSQAPSQLLQAVNPRIRATMDLNEQNELCTVIGRAFLEGKNVAPEIEQHLIQAEKNKRVHLLELAVWKYACSTNLPETVKTLPAVFAWLQEGWKTDKDKYFRCNDVVIVMDLVTPYLADSQPPHEADQDEDPPLVQAQVPTPLVVEPIRDPLDFESLARALEVAARGGNAGGDDSENEPMANLRRRSVALSRSRPQRQPQQFPARNRRGGPRSDYMRHHMNMNNVFMDHP